MKQARIPLHGLFPNRFLSKSSGDFRSAGAWCSECLDAKVVVGNDIGAFIS